MLFINRTPVVVVKRFQQSARNYVVGGFFFLFVSAKLYFTCAHIRAEYNKYIYIYTKHIDFAVKKFRGQQRIFTRTRRTDSRARSRCLHNISVGQRIICQRKI